MTRKSTFWRSFSVTNVMNRIWSVVSGTLRALTPKVLSGSPSMEINSSRRYAEHLARVREAMQSLAPKDQVLPSQGRAVAFQAAKSGSDNYRTATEMFAAANALFQVCLPISTRLMELLTVSDSTVVPWTYIQR